MTESETIRANVEALLAGHGISYAATLTQRGALIPPTEKGGKPWECDRWNVIFSRSGCASFVLDYKTGIGHRKPPPRPAGAPFRPGTIAHESWMQGAKCIAPLAADVLCSVTLDDTHGADFADWCADFGYDEDSRSAFNLYETCQKQTREARAFFGRELFGRIAEALEGY